MKKHPQKSSASALQYTGHGAPRVIAKGEGETAERIINTAQANDVPLIEDAALSQVLGAVPLGDEIPENLYIAVAEVLVHLYNLEDGFRSYRS